MICEKEGTCSAVVNACEYRPSSLLATMSMNVYKRSTLSDLHLAANIVGQLTDVIPRSGCKDCGRPSHAATSRSCSSMSQYAHQRNRSCGWRFGVDTPGHFGSTLQHTILVGMRPTSFTNWTPKQGSLYRTASKRLFTTLLAPSVARPYVAAGTKGTAFSRHWNVDFTEVTRSAAIEGRNLEECVDKRKKKNETTLVAPNT